MSEHREARFSFVFLLRGAVLALFLPSFAMAQQATFDLHATLKHHCLDCHSSGDDSEGGLDLSDLRSTGNNPEVILKVLRAVDRMQMPPQESEALSSEERNQLVRAVQNRLKRLAESSDHRSTTSIRRMNRFQYNNAVMDLFDLKVIVFTLPERIMRDHKGYFDPKKGKMPDVVTVGSRPLGKSQMIEPRLASVAAFPQDLRAEHGFDNQADHLSLSPLLMESFLKLGQSVTQSPDFVPQNVGIWKQFFAPARKGKPVKTVVTKRLTHFLLRAFRRPADTEALDRYVNFVMNRLDSGSTMPDAMKAVAAAVIASPRFLYLYNSKETPDATGSDCFDVASRLSFFLWGSIPDGELLRLATDGRLLQKDVLADQVQRMLTDRKLKRFCDSFPAQWLQLDRIISSVPEPEQFPGFYFSKYRNSMHMILEPLLVFETVLIENRPVRELIDSDFTYRSKRLNNAYGALKIEGKHDKLKGGNEVGPLSFRRLPVTDRRSGGVMTTAAVMTMTSGPERTQPITRGAWMATVIFNDPPEPPPADVPPLDENSAHDEQNLTLRERLSLHRERSDCRGCHEQIDPLGFAFENYDAIGRWRGEYQNGRDIDVSGSLFRRHRFTNILEYKEAILAEEREFQNAFAGHLLSFALARKLSAIDHVAVDKIVEMTESQGGGMQTLIQQVIFSRPFLQTHLSKRRSKHEQDVN